MSLLLLPPASARVLQNENWGRDRFAAAERLHEALQARPANERTRHYFQRAIDAYRRVYLGCPTCAKADPSAAAAADLLVDMGRQFNDDSILRSAIKQYQFLRREYPGTSRRVEAAFAIAEIYKDDLDEPKAARAAFQDFLKHYPHSHLSDDARDALAEIDQASSDAATPKTEPKKSTSADAGQPDGENVASRSGAYQKLSAIHFFSQQDYTRVAIDLEHNVRFEAQTINHPNRFFFDLYETRLASGLAGKNFEVNDPFLKKIRVAQFQRGRSRVVLEVSPSSDFNAFFQSNPSRLIIDIREKQITKAHPEQADSRTIAKAVSPAKLAAGAVPLEVPIRASSARIESDAVVITPQFPSASNTPPIPKRIVEADDDDDSDANLATTAKTAKASSSTAKEPFNAHGKRRSADGNNDEVATLAPRGESGETKPLIDAVTRSTAQPKSTNGRRKLGISSELDAREAKPTMAGDRSLIRALGLKIGRIVIDPGHGGHDTGTIGPNGLQEKDLVLEVGRRLGKLLESRVGADVVFTRDDDTFIPLETRTSIANQEQADLFVSIHANSSRDPDARGVETYYLNFTSNADALEVASRENAVSDKSIHELQDLVKKIALKEKIEESREFATDVQRSLHNGLAVKNAAIRDRGVKKAPFIVLIGANMPSILAEISFVSNPTDARKLQTADYRQRIAESLYRGIAKYVSGLSGVKVASRLSRPEGQ